jgi:hypothetical protein
LIEQWVHGFAAVDTAATHSHRTVDARPTVSAAELLGMLCPLLDDIAGEVATRLADCGADVPADLLATVRSAAWPPVSDTNPLAVHALVMLERRVVALESALRATHELLKRLVGGDRLNVERISATSAGPNYVMTTAVRASDTGQASPTADPKPLS